jgi:S1-C subfamily serine protease
VIFSDSLRGLAWSSPTTLGLSEMLLVADGAVRNHRPLRSLWPYQLSRRRGIRWSTSLAIVGGLLGWVLSAAAWGDTTDSLVIHQRQWQAKLVKIYGAGGPKGLESYQSGFLVSEAGHVVTSWSTVLDVSSLRVVTHDGRKDDAEVVGMDPQTEIAVLKTKEPAPDFFSLEATGGDPGTRVGSRVFGLSNLFGIAAGDEALSIQRGVIMAVAPLSATRGRMKTLYQGQVLILDVMTNNPGATGGAVVDADGRLLGMLGKELRDDQTNIWLNYAIPVDVIATSVKRILEGKTATSARAAQIQPAARPHNLLSLGMLLIPDVLPKTPPFVDQILPGSIADRAGVVPNDLILLVNEQRIDSRKALESLLIGIDQADPLRLLVQRGQELVQLEVKP